MNWKKINKSKSSGFLKQIQSKMQFEQVLVGTNEIIARSIHKNYRHRHPSMVSWDELPEGLKESNHKRTKNRLYCCR